MNASNLDVHHKLFCSAETATAFQIAAQWIFSCLHINSNRWKSHLVAISDTALGAQNAEVENPGNTCQNRVQQSMGKEYAIPTDGERLLHACRRTSLPTSFLRHSYAINSSTFERASPSRLPYRSLTLALLHESLVVGLPALALAFSDGDRLLLRVRSATHRGAGQTNGQSKESRRGILSRSSAEKARPTRKVPLFTSSSPRSTRDDKSTASVGSVGSG